MRRSLLALAALAAPLALTACKKDAPPAPAAPAVKWPEKPANGAPIALVFQKFEGEGDAKVGVFTVFNFADTNLTRFSATLEYLDASGKVVKTFPHGHMQVVGGKSAEEIKAGVFIPAEATSARAVIRTTQHGTGTQWTAPEAAEPAAVGGTVPMAPASAAPSEAPAAAPASEAPAAAPASDAPAAPGSEAGADPDTDEAEGEAE